MPVTSPPPYETRLEPYQSTSLFYYLPVYQMVNPIQPPHEKPLFFLEFGLLGVFLSLLSAKTLVLRTTRGAVFSLWFHGVAVFL